MKILKQRVVHTLSFMATLGSVSCLLEGSTPAADSLLVPVATAEPSRILYPPKKRTDLWPIFNEVAGPKHTNKFWGLWTLKDRDTGNTGWSIYPSPYTLRFEPVGDSVSGKLTVMKGETDYSGDKEFSAPWDPHLSMGALEKFSAYHTIVKENIFGVHVELRPAEGFSCQVTFPVYAGMAFTSAKYENSCTPRIDSDSGLQLVEKVKAGVWRFQKNASTLKEYRVYVLTPDGNNVDDTYDFDSSGVLNKQLAGWVRIADLQVPGDGLVLDSYARTILTGMELEVTDGQVEYKFETVGPQAYGLLHWAYANHMAFLTGKTEIEKDLTRTRSPTKGLMWPLVSGNKRWTFTVDLTDALAVDFLPARQPQEKHLPEIKKQLSEDWNDFKKNWRLSMHKKDHYFSAKGFQKLGTICLLLAKYDKTQVTECAETLKAGFECMYRRSVSDSSDRRDANEAGEDCQAYGCWESPAGQWYDDDWKGLASRLDNSKSYTWFSCDGQVDFGNSCYNDHHYHWGYFVVAGAMLVKLDPNMKSDTEFVNFINMFIRDAANPSKTDTHFPQFRAFDWYDMHSWSRGLLPDQNGKDQESTSEEVNLHYGVMLWGAVLGNDKMRKLGATMLTLASQSLQDYFLNLRDSPHYPEKFSKLHVTGIFFQNKMMYKTWFGENVEYIHGVQMLPLTSALFLSRKPEFCAQEWDDILKNILPVDHTDAWWSILLSGNLAMHSPDEAWEHLVKMRPQAMDDGLTKTWALYWTSVQPVARTDKVASSRTLHLPSGSAGPTFLGGLELPEPVQTDIDVCAPGSVSPPSPRPPSPPSPPSPPPSTAPRDNTMLIIVIVLMLLGGAALFLWASHRNSTVLAEPSMSDRVTELS